MFKYKRGINDINSLKNLQFILTNGIDTCLNLSAGLDSKKIYNGLYIKNAKILVENVFEKIQIKDSVYRIGQVLVGSEKISSDEYITSVDLEKNVFEYDVSNFKYKKRIAFDTGNSDVLVIEYDLVNDTNNEVKFFVLPIITYRDLLSIKNSNALKFNIKDTKNSAYLNLSVTNNSNLFLASDYLQWKADNKYLSNVQHEFIDKNLERKVFSEDLDIPGSFAVKLKSKESKKVHFYISTSEFDITKIDYLKIFERYEKDNIEITEQIQDEFVELKSLAITMKNSYLDSAIADSVPYSISYDDFLDLFKTNKITDELLINLTNLVRSIEGRYLNFGKLNEAKSFLHKIEECIESFDLNACDNNKIQKECLLLMLWTIESINRLIQVDNDETEFFDFIRDSIYKIIKDEKIKKCVLNNIELISLLYNAIKIYQNILSNKNQEDSTTYDLQEEIQDIVNHKFWIEEKRILKENLDDNEHFAKISMIYTLSLSYPVLTNEIGIKLLDTIFKELYTPYGIREYSKFSKASNGLIYPKYMAHFVKANLRQNGVTRASQKLAYNLVKELLQDISKYINGGVRKIYSEKGVLVDNLCYDILTNSELIRLYNMLT